MGPSTSSPTCCMSLATLHMSFSLIVCFGEWMYVLMQSHFFLDSFKAPLNVSCAYMSFFFFFDRRWSARNHCILLHCFHQFEQGIRRPIQGPDVPRLPRWLQIH